MIPCMALRAQGKLQDPRSRNVCTNVSKVLGVRGQASMGIGSDLPNQPYCCREEHCKCQKKCMTAPRCRSAPTNPKGACFFPSMCQGYHAFGMPLAQQVDAVLGSLICHNGQGSIQSPDEDEENRMIRQKDIAVHRATNITALEKAFQDHLWPKQAICLRRISHSKAGPYS